MRWSATPQWGFTSGAAAPWLPVGDDSTPDVATQRADGGWAQRNELSSDAYATGQSLFALASAIGTGPEDKAYARGIRFLLSTQRADGSWYVRSRSPKFQPFFESGFPYGHDQWISMMATGWGAAALARGVPDASTNAQANNR